MRALQILFLISFAVLALVIPLLIFGSIQGGNSNTLIVLIVLIFAVNGFFIVRRLLAARKDK